MENREAIIEWCDAHDYLWMEEDGHIYWQTEYQTIRDDGKCYDEDYLDFLSLHKLNRIMAQINKSE